MIATPLAMLLLFAALQESDTPQPASPPYVQKQPAWTAEQMEQIRQKTKQMLASLEPRRKAAIRLNALADNLHTEADARAFVDGIAEELSGHSHLFWFERGFRHRVAHAEFETASDPSKLIPEQRVVDVWNEWAREIVAPEEVLISVAELHNFRDRMYANAQMQWKRPYGRSLWSMPQVHAVDSTGRVAEGCRAVEAVKILQKMYDQFSMVRPARASVKAGSVASDMSQHPDPELVAKQRARILAYRATLQVPQAGTVLAAQAKYDPDPLRPAEARYVQDHGERAYRQLLERLFRELFPPQ